MCQPNTTERAAYEIEVICGKGYPSYFLIVADLVSYARSVDIRVGPGRGSAAGSLVAYALRITDIDPIEHGLLFERFLNPERASMPDIDIDFDDRRRGEMVRYAADKWGHDRVAQVITFGTIKTKAALKDSARIHYGQPGFAIADRITKALPPPIMAKDIPLSGITDPTHERYKEAAEVRGLIDTDPDVRTIYETARGLEGLIRNAGVHACAVIMSSEPLIEAIPLWKRPQDGAIITGWDYPSCEAIGLLKMDFLGLRNLTIIGDALENIKANRGIELDLESLPLDDGPTYELLGPRRHARRVPARRRPDARPAASHAAHRVRGRRRRHRAVPARSDGHERPQRLCRPQERPPGDQADPPRAGRAARGDPRRDLRPDRLPRADHAHRAEGGGLLAGPSRHSAQSHGQEEARGARQGVRGLLGGHEGQRVLRQGDQGAVGHRAAVRGLRVQQVTRRGLRAGVLLDGLSEGQLSGRVHGGSAHIGR